jgi:hypothetical protein
MQVLESFAVWALWMLLPMVPAVLIFRMFPDAKAFVRGPLQGLSFTASGAFAGWVVAVALGFFPVRYLQTQISATRYYHFEGVIELGAGPQTLESADFFSRFETIGPEGRPGTRNLHFIALLDTPTESKPIQLSYWSGTGASGLGPRPVVPFQMVITGADSYPQKFKLDTDVDPPKVVRLARARIVAPGGITAAPLSAGIRNLDWFIHPTLASRDSGAKVALASFSPIPDAPIEKNSDDPAPLGLQAPVSNKCLTPGFFCFLPGYGPVGAPCWCASPYGPVAGRVGY